MNKEPNVVSGSTMPAPLKIAPDMPARWSDVELDFDTAAGRLIEAHKKDGEAEDMPIADLKTWAVAPHAGQFALVPLMRHHTPKVLRNNGFANLMARIGAPSEFIRRLPANLALVTINYLLAEHDDRSSATLRLRGDEVTAVVSGRYAPLDVEDLVTSVRDALKRFDLLQDVRVRGLASGVHDNLRLVLPEENVVIKVGDVSSVGLDISTSSFGRSAIHLSPMVWRLVCTNGLRAPERRGQLSFRHIGDVDRLRAGIMEGIPSALAHSRGLIGQWRRSIDVLIDDVSRQVEEMRELTTLEKKAVESQVARETEMSMVPARAPLYALVNAITATAKGAAPARRLELEAFAGHVLQRHVGAAS